VDISEASKVLGLGNLGPSMRDILAQEGPGLSTPRLIVSELKDVPVPDDISSWPTNGARLAPPIPDPGVLIDFYAFEEHVRRARAGRGLDIVPEWFEYPVYYRSNQRSLVAPGATVHFPAGEELMDFELELAAVLGAPIESPSPEEAEAAIAGYCLFNDWSARSIQGQVMKVGLGPAKGKDFASSLGPYLVTPDELGPLADLRLQARVNGETWSENTPGAMAWSWGEMLAFAGEGVRFEPGDIFGSGTVGGGCGLELGRFLSEGDTVELDGGPSLGVLTGTVGQRKPQSGGTEAS
ncbi:MAG: fumarylacetoacetate hydrolase family protein, partial [Acidobacteriota bacterium]